MNTLTLDAHEQLQLSKAVASAPRRPTRWCAITGAPGSGKTTLVKFLESQGWPVIEDPGRAVLQQHLAHGIEIERSGKRYMEFQQEVLEHQQSAIARTDPALRVFFDYGIAESLAFMKLAGLPWPVHFIEAAAAVQFERVFLLSPLTLKQSNDGIRVETHTQRQQLWKLIGDVYRGLGMCLVDVPQGTPDQRFVAVLNAIA